MTILITGAHGFIGRKVLELLLQEGHAVVSLVRKPSANLSTTSKFTEVVVDLATGSGLAFVPWSNIDTVIHLAAAGVKSSTRVWSEAIWTNIRGTMNLLDSVGKIKSRNPTVLLFRTFYENFTEQNPALLDNPYIASKALAYRFSQQWEQTYSGKVIYATLFQVYGPGDKNDSVLSYAVAELRARRKAMFGSGRGMRDWIYIDDAARAVLAIVNSGETFQREVDIGTGDLHSIREMVEQIVDNLKLSRESCVFDPARDRPDVGIEARALCKPKDWSPIICVSEGIKNLLEKI